MEIGIAENAAECSGHQSGSTGNSLEAFISDTDMWTDDIMQTLGWTKEHVLQEENRVVCPNNRGHVVAQDDLELHLTFCPILCKGYSKKEITADRSSKFYYQKAPAVLSIDLDEQTLKAILANAGPMPTELPETMARAEVTLNAAQRLRIYEHCIEIARASNAATHIADEELTLLEDKREDKPLSKLELMAKMRDMKRRRQSYRGKNTHTSKKNHTEVIRDVLNNQMEILASIWAEEAREKMERKRKQQEEVEKAARKEAAERCKKSSSSRHRSQSRSSSHVSCRHGSKHRHSSRQRDDGGDDEDDDIKEDDLRVTKESPHDSKSRTRRFREEKSSLDTGRRKDKKTEKSSSSRHKKRSRSRSRSRSQSRHKHKRHRHIKSEKNDSDDDKTTLRLVSVASSISRISVKPSASRALVTPSDSRMLSQEVSTSENDEV